MGVWKLECPRGGKYECEGHYSNGHGNPFKLECDTIKTIRAPKGASCEMDNPDNPGRRRYLPSGLTECEKTHPGVKRKLSRCIKKVEKRCCPSGERDYSKCSCNPVAVCRASVKCP